MITPDAIANRTKKIYRKFLKQWLGGTEGDFFPYRVNADLKLDRNNPQLNLPAIERLREKSKEQRGWGYTLVFKRLESPVLGHNDVPSEVRIDTLDDLLRLSKSKPHFGKTERVVQRLREELPGLESWMRQRVTTLEACEPQLDGLIAVARYLIDHPRPGCFAQQLPVPVDTKFVGRHRVILTQWLNELLPSVWIDLEATDFPARFGLRKSSTFRGVLLLDDSLTEELGWPFDLCAVPCTSLAKVVASNVTVVIYENQKSYVSLPKLPRSIGVCGEGAAAYELASVPFIQQNRVLYWGDIDAAGLAILSQLRARLPQVGSVLMNLEVVHNFVGKLRSGQGFQPKNVHHLTAEEQASFDYCCKHNVSLEQERILQDQVHAAFAEKFAIG